MQEDIERRSIAIVVNASKLTGRALAKACLAALRQIQKGYLKSQTPQGKQSIEKLMNHGVATNTLDLDYGTKLFEKVAKKWSVDYSFKKVGSDKHLLLFKSGQADAITACLSEYADRALKKSRRPSIAAQLKHFTEKSRSQPKERQRTREVSRNGR